MTNFTDKIKTHLEQLKGVYPGLAIAVLDRGDETFYFEGVENSTTNQPIDENTPFEIASVTKVFTATLAAKFATDELIDLDSPAQLALPEHVQLPRREGEEITFRQLSSHSSGLPRLPENLDLTKVDGENPYVDYSTEDLYECLNSLNDMPDLGREVCYSNLGVGLLGHLLGRIDGTDYERAVRKHVIEPLGMTSTAINLPSETEKRLAQPHSGKEPVVPWEFQDSTVAAGGLKSTIADLTKFLRANLKPDSTSLGSAIKLTHEPRLEDQQKLPITTLQILGPLVLAFLSMLVMWFFNTRPGNFVFFVEFFFAAIVSSIIFRWWSSLIATTAMVVFCYWQFGVGFGWATSALVGGFIAYLAWRSERTLNLESKGRLGWQEDEFGGFEFIWHNGMVGGSASYIGFVPARNQGVVILANTSVEVDSLGALLLFDLILD